MADEDDKDLDRDDDRQDDEDSSAEGDDGDAEVAVKSEREEAAQIAREEELLAAGPEEDGVITGLLGVERWVQFTFIALAFLIFFVSDALIGVIWSNFQEPDPTVVSVVAAILGIGGAFALYRNPRTNELATEVISELSKVTWPTRDETYYSTVVVIVTSVIAAVYTGLFDAAWSKVTDLIYTL
jgi:preprotein translocase subunit SecE